MSENVYRMVLSNGSTEVPFTVKLNSVCCIVYDYGTTEVIITGSVLNFEISQFVSYNNKRYVCGGKNRFLIKNHKLTLFNGTLHNCKIPAVKCRTCSAI